MVRFVKERGIRGFVVNLGGKNGKKGNVRVNKSRDDNEHSSHFVLERIRRYCSSFLSWECFEIIIGFAIRTYVSRKSLISIGCSCRE